MFKYLRDYKIEDMRQLIRNTKTPHKISPTSLEGKTAIVAGATSGVGLSAVRELARYGCNILIIARDRSKAESVCTMIGKEFGGKADFILADFTKLTEVHRAAELIRKKCNRVDILINSAGIFSTKKMHTEDGFETVFSVNYLAPFILTYKLIPLMLHNPDGGRIIEVNSQGHRFGGLKPGDLNWKRRIYSGFRSYGASKTAQLLSVWEFAEKLKGTGLTINAMHPGAVKSGIGKNNGRLYNWYIEKILWKKLDDPLISGEALHYLAADPEMEEVSGAYFNLTHAEKPAPHALDREAGKILWKRTLDMTGLNDEL